ncbi:MAG: hypothetical protein CMM32_07540 [Rhodospirillaceae bacterium]|nr:hypothetical protein [Rhodospirillaceae bacterium]
MISPARHIPLLDKLAVSTSTLCAIHCLFLPILLGFFPALGTTLFGDEFFHVLLLWLVIPLSLVALSLGCRKHRDVMVAMIGLSGLTSLLLAATLGHSALGQSGEQALTLTGAAMIALGHLRNYKLCRSSECDT